MVSKPLIAAAFMAVASALPLSSVSVVERDPNSLVKFYIPSVGEPETEDVNALAKRATPIIAYIGDQVKAVGDETIGVPAKRDPNSLVKFYIPGVGEPDEGNVDTLAKRDPNSLVKFYIPSVGEPSEGDVNALAKRAPIFAYALDEVETLGDETIGTPAKRDPNSLVKFYIPGVGEPDEGNVDTLAKRDPNSLVTFYIPKEEESA